MFGSGVRGRLFPISIALFALIGIGALAESGGLSVTRVCAALLVAAVFAAVVSELSARAALALVRPLTDAARRIHAGDLSVRPRSSEDESRELGQALDRLAASLAKTLGELRAERDLLSGILEGMQEGVMLLDTSGNVALMNPAFREMLLVRGDMVGRPLLEVVRHAELKELLDRARRLRSACSGEIEVSGLKPRRLLVRATAFEGEGGGVLAVFFDVTEIRRLESLRRDFVANVSHELRTPVTAVLSAAETLRYAAARDPEAAERFLGIIERNAERLQRLIEDLLDLSRIESRELKLSPELFPFRPFAQHVAGLFKERADKKGIGLTCSVDGGVEVFADRRALEQIFTNLVDNAVKYCPEGTSVTVGATIDGPLARLTVTDTGAGMDPQHLPRIFERFYRVDAGRSREVGGTGLGLAIVKHLSEAMGGAVRVESEIGRGTTFTVSLPAHKIVPREHVSTRILP